MAGRNFKPSINPNDRYAVSLGIENGKTLIIESYPTEELLEKGYKSWIQSAQEIGLTKPARIRFVDANDKLTSYSKSNGKCMLTDSELMEILGVN